MLPQGFNRFAFAPESGQSEAAGTVWCRLVIERPGKPAQNLVTIEQGFSEAMSCEGLAEAGVLDPSGNVPRIGLLYRTQSPNAESITPVVIAQTGAGSTWIVDDASSAKLADLPGKPSLARMRHASMRQAVGRH